MVPIDKVEGYARKGLSFYGGAIALSRFHNHVTDWERDEYLEVY